MSTQTKDKPVRRVRQSIPRLLPRNTDKITDNSQTTKTNGSQTQKECGVGDASDKTDKSKLEKKPTNHYRERIVVDDHSKLRRPLSLQGPFNPNIVGYRNNSDETKRKRNPTATLTTKAFGFGFGKAQSKSHVASTSNAPFSAVQNETDYPKPKRNHGPEKQKCTVDFSHKPETGFAANTDKLIVFTASAHTSTSSGNVNVGVGGQRPPRNFRRTSASSGSATNTSAAGTRTADLRRTSDEGLRENIQHLEGEKLRLTQTIQKSKSEVSDLTNKLSTAKETETKLKVEIENLKKALVEQELENTGAVEENSDYFNLCNKAIEQRLELCQKKLEEMQIDPVSFDGLEGCTPEVLAEASRKAAEEAEKLRLLLKTSSKSNKELIDKLQDSKGDKLADVQDTKENQLVDVKISSGITERRTDSP